MVSGVAAHLDRQLPRFKSAAPMPCQPLQNASVKALPSSAQAAPAMQVLMSSASSPALVAQSPTAPSISAVGLPSTHSRKGSHCACPELCFMAQLKTRSRWHSAGPCWHATPSCSRHHEGGIEREVKLAPSPVLPSYPRVPMSSTHKIKVENLLHYRVP